MRFRTDQSHISDHNIETLALKHMNAAKKDWVLIPKTKAILNHSGTSATNPKRKLLLP
jgi:hypothetical protein